MPSDYLTAAQVADRLGVKASTWRAWVARGKAPAADYRFGRDPGWLPATIDAWEAARPGPGWWGPHERKDRNDSSTQGRTQP